MPRRYANIKLDPTKYMVWEPFVKTKEQAEKRAAKRDQYETSRLPLFADQLPKNDPQHYLDYAQQWAEDFNFGHKTLIRRARLYRYMLAKHLTSGQMAALQKRREAAPLSPEYEADFWRHRLKEYLAGTLEMEYRIVRNQKEKQ